MVDRLISGSVKLEDSVYERGLRPRRLQEFIGQPKLKERLRIFMQAARERGEPIEHVLFYGPPGLGKTTLANILAEEMGVKIKTTSGPAVERPGDLAADLTRMDRADILFIDEIHRLSHTVEEYLYPAMEDFALDLVTGKGPSASSIRLPLKPFTLIGATTRMALLTGPLRDRFGMVFALDFYDEESLTEIVFRSARILGVVIDAAAARELASRSRGTPRVANRLLRRIRDYAQVRVESSIGAPFAREVLAELEIDELGLDEVDRKLLRALALKFGGGPVGLQTLSAATGEDADTIMDVYEPFLLRLGFLDRTPRGRLATRAAFAHLGAEFPASIGQPTLFEVTSSE